MGIAREDKTDQGKKSMHETSDGFKEPIGLLSFRPRDLTSPQAMLVSYHFLFEHCTLARGQETYGNALLRVQSFWKHKSFLD